MAVSIPCQTPGATYHTMITEHGVDNHTCVSIEVDLPLTLALSNDDAKHLEDNLHNAVELVLSRYFDRSPEFKRRIIPLLQQTQCPPDKCVYGFGKYCTRCGF